MREHPLSNTILREMFIKYGKLIFLAMIKGLNILLKLSSHKRFTAAFVCAYVWVGAVSAPCIDHTPI